MTETAPAPALKPADPDEPMTAHYVCHHCHLRGASFPIAVCGERLLGIHASDADRFCDTCLGLTRQPVLPCGH